MKKKLFKNHFRKWNISFIQKDTEGKKHIPMPTTSHFKKKHYKWSPILCFFPQMHSLSSYEERAVVLSLGWTWLLLTAQPGWIGVNCWDFCFTFHLGSHLGSHVVAPTVPLAIRRLNLAGSPLSRRFNKQPRSQRSPGYLLTVSRFLQCPHSVRQIHGLESNRHWGLRKPCNWHVDFGLEPWPRERRRPRCWWVRWHWGQRGKVN